MPNEETPAERAEIQARMLRLYCRPCDIAGNYILQKGTTMQDFPRRKQLDKMEPEELALFALTQQIEKMGAHPLLTDVVILLGEAREKLGAYVDWALVAKPERGT
jgi:hypothetical protein